MSTVKTNNVQVGQSGTAANNFTLYQPSAPDGTVRLANGNSPTTSDVMQLNSAGDFAINAGFGSVGKAFLCRAWVNFNGTGTVAIRASGNVSSITDNGVGDYTVNFATAMPDANYSASMQILENSARIFTVTSLTTSGIRINCMNTAQTLTDNAAIGVAIFR